MNQSHIDGILLFLRYAWPCAEEKRRKGLIGTFQYYLFEQVLFGGVMVDYGIAQILESCLGVSFKKACHDLFIFSFSRKSGQIRHRWSLQNIQEFWRHHHTGTGDCAVTRVIIHSVSEDKKSVFAIPSGGGEMITIINLYQLPLKVGDFIFVHRCVAIETE